MKSQTKIKKRSASRTAARVGSGAMVRPRSAAESSFDQLAEIGRDNWDHKDHWLLTDGYTVTLCAQKSGEEPTQKITLPRGIFNRLIRSYLRPQRIQA